MKLHVFFGVVFRIDFWSTFSWKMDPKWDPDFFVGTPFLATFFGHRFWKALLAYIWLPFGSIFVHLGSLSALLGSLSRPFGFFGVAFCSVWLFFGSYYAPLAPFWCLFGTCCSFSRFLLCFLFISRDVAWISNDFLLTPFGSHFTLYWFPFGAFGIHFD